MMRKSFTRETFSISFISVHIISVNTLSTTRWVQFKFSTISHRLFNLHFTFNSWHFYTILKKLKRERYSWKKRDDKKNNERIISKRYVNVSENTSVRQPKHTTRKSEQYISETIKPPSLLMQHFPCKRYPYVAFGLRIPGVFLTSRALRIGAV